jgi:trimeric autotransporter adhesin
MEFSHCCCRHLLIQAEFRVKAPAAGGTNGTYSVTMKYSLGDTATSPTALKAGTYSFNAVVKSNQAGSVKTEVFPFNIVVGATPVAAVAAPVAANAKAVIEAISSGSVTALTDSVTAGSSAVASTPVGMILVSNFDATSTATKDTVTATITGPGYLKNSSSVGRTLTVVNANTVTFEVYADGTAGEAKITLTTVAGASFVKTVTFFTTKPAKVVATVAKAYPKAGGTTVEAISAVVTDALGNAITAGGVTVTAAPTDTATTVGGASQTCQWDATDKAYWCSVAGKAADKFGPVAYTITATGTGLNIASKVTTSATVTFADNVATKAVLAGPATGTPGASVEYTLTLTEKNGYPVADMVYGVGAAGGVLFSATAADRVVSGWATAPFSASDSFTSKSGVITSSWRSSNRWNSNWFMDTYWRWNSDIQVQLTKTIGKTKVTVSTDVNNPGVDAATDAANEATDAANAATDAALAAAEAADAATTAAQEASDAVAALSASVTKLIEGLQAQIKSLAAVVAKIAKKVKA